MPAPIENYATLVTSVGEYFDRPDLEGDIRGFIQLADVRFNGALRAREQQTSAVVAASASEGTLPDDFLEWVVLAWSGSGRISYPTFAEPDSPEMRYKHRPGGDPQYFTVVDDIVRVAPARAGELTLTYYAEIPELSPDADVNWLVLKAPDAYLYATLAEAYFYIKDPNQAQANLQLAMGALSAAGIKADAQKLSRRSGREAELTASAQAAGRPD